LPIGIYVGKGREQDAEALLGMRKLCRGAEALRAAIFCEIVARKQTLTVVLAARLKILPKPALTITAKIIIYEIPD
jgi:hypothetical protein